MSEEMKVFTNFVGIIKKIQTITTGDGDYRITIDIPATSKAAVKELMDYQDKICGFAVGHSSAPVVKSDHEDHEEF